MSEVFHMGKDNKATGTSYAIGAYGKMYTDLDELRHDQKLIQDNPIALLYVLEKNKNQTIKTTTMKNLLPPKKEWPVMLAAIVSFTALIAFMWLVTAQSDSAIEMRQSVVDFEKYVRELLNN